jgi:hypothetical protein
VNTLDCESVPAGDDASSKQRLCWCDVAGAASLAGWQRSVMDGQCPSSGLDQHSRCWYLSRKASTCATTCSEKGLMFSHFVADAQATLIPQLTGRRDLRQQQTWGALECYAEEEDRYHPAAHKDARGGDNPAAWQDPNCRLACPCTACPGGGLWKHGRCWYLSHQGSTCDVTCSSKGLAFLIYVSNEEEPMVPELLNLNAIMTADDLPKFKQNSWGAIECLVPSESRFHTATPNGVGAEDPGKWSHSKCQLACSCEVPI